MKYVIPVTYMMYGSFMVEADNINEALDKVFDADDLPEDAEYLDDSISVSEENTRELNPTLSENDQEDLSEYLTERYRQMND